MGRILHSRSLGFGGVVKSDGALLHPVEEAVVVSEGDGVKVGESESGRAGEALIEEDVFDDDGADLLVEGCESIVTRRRRRRRRGARKV